MKIYMFIALFNVLITVMVKSTDWRYHNNTDIEVFLKNITVYTKDKLDIRTNLYSIGKSRNKNDIWVLEITATNNSKRSTPNIKLLGTVHGNEPVGREVLLHFVEFLVDNYKIDPEVTWLLENTRIHVLPNLNPDGFALAREKMCVGVLGRANSNNEDLNRNFPDFFYRNYRREQPETKAIRSWMKKVPFILSSVLHGGAVVANYPFDTAKESGSRLPSLTPDNDVFHHLAETYSKNHLTMHTGVNCGQKKQIFKDGITNGNAWYNVKGSMQDYNYAFYGCMELTLEILCCKYPSASTLPTFFEQNKIALVKYSLESLKGVTGQVLDGNTLKPISFVALQISGRNMTFFTTKTGEFWRLLMPGEYSLEMSANGYHNKNVSFVVKNYNMSLPQLTDLSIFMFNSSFPTTTTAIIENTTQQAILYSAPYRITETITLDGAHDYYLNILTTSSLINNITLMNSNGGHYSCHNLYMVLSGIFLTFISQNSVYVFTASIK